LTSYETIVSLIAATRTLKGLRVKAELDLSKYPIGVAVTPDEVARLQLERATFHGEWNYTLRPRTAEQLAAAAQKVAARTVVTHAERRARWKGDRQPATPERTQRTGFLRAARHQLQWASSTPALKSSARSGRPREPLTNSRAAPSCPFLHTRYALRRRNGPYRLAAYPRSSSCWPGTLPPGPLHIKAPFQPSLTLLSPRNSLTGGVQSSRRAIHSRRTRRPRSGSGRPEWTGARACHPAGFRTEWAPAPVAPAFAGDGCAQAPRLSSTPRWPLPRTSPW